MKGRPIIMSGGEVRAILEGRKSQMRRPIKPQPGVDKDFFGWRKDFACFGVSPMTTLDVRSTYIPGDHLYVREPSGNSSPFLPKKDARIWLDVTDVRVQRLQDIMDEEMKEEV